MDLMCSRCLEPWELDYVTDPDVVKDKEFKRNGALIVHCPACPKGKPKLTKAEQDKAAIVYALSDLLGDDMDGAACMLEDMEMGF